jgi:tetratricopeptide (TPR) repeat protein
MNRQHWRCMTLLTLVSVALTGQFATAAPMKPPEQASAQATKTPGQPSLSMKPQTQPGAPSKPMPPAKAPAAQASAKPQTQAPTTAQAGVKPQTSAKTQSTKSQDGSDDSSVSDDRAFLDQLDQLPSKDSLTSDPLIQKAIECYKSGNLEKAIPILVQDLKEHPENGTAHYYLGIALKKIGQDANAINELETAIKICPPGLTQALAAQALHGKLPPEPKKVAPPIWSTVLAAATGTMFGVETTATTHGVAFKPPDIAGPVSDAIKRGKELLKHHGQAPPQPQSNQIGAPRPYSSAADVMSLGDLMSLASQSRSFDPKFRSDPQGVIRYAQAPEFTPEWDRWIIAFRKAFNRQLFRHLGQDYKSETGGLASAIFSVDNQGHLRGCIYKTTADDTINQCLIKTIRDMNGTYVLAFPPTTHVTGWNFNISWNFARALAVIKLQKERQALADAKLRSLEVAAKLKQQLEKEEKAKALKLAQVPPKPKPSLQIRQKVSAQLMPKAKPLELKAKPMKLTDLPPVKPGVGPPAGPGVSQPAAPVTAEQPVKAGLEPLIKPGEEVPPSLTMQDIQDDDMDVSDLFK